MSKKYKFLLLALALLVLVAFTPVLQNYTPFANIRVQHDSQLNTMTVSGAANFDGAVDFDGAVVGGSLTGDTLTLEGVVQSGPVVFGSQAAATDGITITHGLGTTPTMVVLSPAWASDEVTQTLYVSSLSATVFAVEITTGTVTNTTVYWIAGR